MHELELELLNSQIYHFERPAQPSIVVEEIPGVETIKVHIVCPQATRHYPFKYHEMYT